MALNIIIGEDDPGHANLIKKNLKRAGIHNNIVHFIDGQQIIDYLNTDEEFSKESVENRYLMLLDIRMPKVDGIEVLKHIKEDPYLKTMPVIMLTTTKTEAEVQLCHALGCNSYITKPVDYDEFVEAIKQLGLYIQIVRLPRVKLNADSK